MLSCAKDPDDPEEERRILAHSKSSLARRVPSLAFRLVAEGEWSRVERGGESGLSAAELLARAGGRRQAPRAVAQDFPVRELANGAKRSREVAAAAALEGIWGRTLWRAAQAPGVTDERAGSGPGSGVFRVLLEGA